MTIVPGTSLVFEPGLRMTVAARLTAKGDTARPIRFLSLDVAGGLPEVIVATTDGASTYYVQIQGQILG